MNSQSGESELLAQLMATSDQYRRLAAEHKAYSEQLERLARRPFLSENERIEEITLKKKKLMLKDQMYSMLHQFRKEAKTGS